MSEIEFKGELWERTKGALAFYCDIKIPMWIKSNRLLRRKVKREFIAAMKEEMRKQIEKEEDRMLWGDPTSKEQPLGILSMRGRNHNARKHDTNNRYTWWW